MSFNREAARIAGSLRMPDASLEDLLNIVTCRRADGREVTLEEIPLARALSTGEIVRLEEIVLQVPDGRSVTALINATPIHSEEGEVETVVVTLQDMTPLREMERLRTEFMGMVSHELRAPLTSIKGLGNHPPGRDIRPGPCRDARVLSSHLGAGRPHAQPDKRPARCGLH